VGEEVHDHASVCLLPSPFPPLTCKDEVLSVQKMAVGKNNKEADVTGLFIMRFGTEELIVG